MKTKFFLGLILLQLMAFHIDAQQINNLTAEKAAQNWISHYDGFSLSGSEILMNSKGDFLAYQYNLLPIGYLVLSANQSLPPVIAYSLGSVFSKEGEKYNPLQDMLVRDIESRLKHLDFISEDVKDLNRSHWTCILEQEADEKTFEQWPPEGSTSTGGWLETNWTQSYPYNKFCPMDNVNNARSIAGCPAVALSMIIHYQENLNGTQFSDSDDYYHSYAGRQYWIDDDAQNWDFPDFPTLNEYFDTIAVKFLNNTPLKEDEIAALVFGCGVAATQVYTSEVSGTFGVDQAYDAYLRFGYQDAKLIYDSDTSFYTQMKNNIKESRPVHLAVLSNTGQGGHNVVADGYNSNDYFHLNFGWGGSYNGWYLLPEEIPYNLTIIEGAVLDIGDLNVVINETAGFNEKNISIFPNPIKNKMHLTCSDFKTENGLIEILGIDGVRLFKHRVNNGNENIELDLGHLKSGMYFCKISIGNETSIEKIIKE